MNQELEDMLIRDNRAMREAGNRLATAALVVTQESDGVHRLRLEIAEWARVMADEGGRGERHGPARQVVTGVEWWVRLTDQDGVQTEFKTDYLRRSTGQVRTTTRGNQ